MNAENVFKCYLTGSSYLVQYHLNETFVHSKVVNLSKHQNMIISKYIVFWEFYLIYFQDLLTCHLPDLEMAPSKRSQLRCVFTVRFVGVSFNQSQCRMAALGRTRQTPRTTNKPAQNCSIQTQTPHCTDIKHIKWHIDEHTLGTMKFGTSHIYRLPSSKRCHFPVDFCSKLIITIHDNYEMIHQWMLPVLRFSTRNGLIQLICMFYMFSHFIFNTVHTIPWGFGTMI